VGADPIERREARASKCLEEGDLGLHGGHVLGDGVDQAEPLVGTRAGRPASARHQPGGSNSFAGRARALAGNGSARRSPKFIA
jgi:hypothetical protein